jgi:hypothetical protein
MFALALPAYDNPETSRCSAFLLRIGFSAFAKGTNGEDDDRLDTLHTRPAMILF